MEIEKKEDRTHWVVIPRRHRLDPEKWKIANGGKNPIDYMAIDDPLRKFNGRGLGLHGNIWQQRYHDRKDIMIDSTPSMQGSCYFMTRKHWDEIIVRLEDENYGPFSQEAQEVGFKTFFSGGKVVVNKRVWYAHLHKGSRFGGKNYGFSNAQYKKHTVDINKGRIYCNNYWLNTRDYEHDFDWFLEQFPDMPGWGEGWRKKLNEQLKKEGLIK